ncbi:Unknown protein sequence [Pseudomonas syringae pv. syringae]|nr:Unknown protein sequence [Pseudomonas syringae pv. syringae]
MYCVLLAVTTAAADASPSIAAAVRAPINCEAVISLLTPAWFSFSLLTMALETPKHLQLHLIIGTHKHAAVKA